MLAKSRCDERREKLPGGSRECPANPTTQFRPKGMTASNLTPRRRDRLGREWSEELVFPYQRIMAPVILRTGAIFGTDRFLRRSESLRF